MRISWVLACSTNGVIGREGQIPWKLPADMKLFRQITSHRHVLMGRKTYDSIGRPLPNRKNLVITTDKSLHGRRGENLHYFGTIGEAIKYAQDCGEQELMIIGGETIYNATRAIVDKVYLSLVEAEILNGDTFFDLHQLRAWGTVRVAISYPADSANEHSFIHEIYEQRG